LRFLNKLKEESPLSMWYHHGPLSRAKQITIGGGLFGEIKMGRLEKEVQNMHLINGHNLRCTIQNECEILFVIVMAIVTTL
jgi:hypothetical protein